MASNTARSGQPTAEGSQESVADAARLKAPRRLTRQHFALFRGYLDGVSEAQLHASYGDPATDVRITRRLIDTLRDTLSVLARRARDTEAAHLLRLRPGSIPLFEQAAQASSPSLDEFRERVDPDGVYGESDLLALFEEHHPPAASPALDRRAARNARLRRRQAEALARMEANLAQDPRPDHPVDGWFEPAVTARLTAAGLATIADVIGLIDRRGHRWYTSVPRLGAKGGQRIVDWLQLHEQTLQASLSPRALLPRRQWRPEHTRMSRPALAVAPLEALNVPAALDGSKGTNRAPPGGRFETDLRAVFAWLDARSASAHTRRAYRREAERLLLWALLEKGKPLSSLDARDCTEYVEVFLPDPQPAARWVSNRRGERVFSDWRPFAGPLSDRSRETARSIVYALCEWLVRERYLMTNPFAGIARAATPAAFDATERTLDSAQWCGVFESVTREQYTFSEHRDRLALLLAYATGLRRAELADATTDALSVGRLAGVEGAVWRLEVKSARGARRTVLLPVAVMEVLEENLALRGLPALLACPAGTPLLAQARGRQAITPDGIGKIFKSIFSAAAALAEAKAPGTGDELRRVSTHWLRHTHSKHALSHGANLREVGAGLGHAALSTTALYLDNENSGRFLGIETLIRGTSTRGKRREAS
jgi:site-specific recombinase XerD